MCQGNSTLWPVSPLGNMQLILIHSSQLLLINSLLHRTASGRCARFPTTLNHLLFSLMLPKPPSMASIQELNVTNFAFGTIVSASSPTTSLRSAPSFRISPSRTNHFVGSLWRIYLNWTIPNEMPGSWSTNCPTGTSSHCPDPRVGWKTKSPGRRNRRQNSPGPPPPD
jgi:hypothetical protein